MEESPITCLYSLIRKTQMYRGRVRVDTDQGDMVRTAAQV